MPTPTTLDRDQIAALSKTWWLPVVFGVLLLLYSFVILSFTIRTVYAISIALGVGLLFAGIAQLVLFRQAERWKWLIFTGGIVDLLFALLAFAWPQQTFLVLARLIGWVLLVRGTLELVRSFAEKSDGETHWWIGTVIGLGSMVVAVWAIRSPERSAALLVLWVGIALMIRALVLIVVGFTLRRMRPGGAVALA